MKHGAIFDMDGTLLDTEKFYSQGWLIVADYFGLERKADLPSTMSGTSWGVMPEILHKFYPGIDAQAYIDKVVEYCESESNKNLEIMPGVYEILEYFKLQNVLMAVASSSNRNVIEEKLQRVNLLKYFDALIGGNEVQNGKPDPEIFLKSAAAMKIAPENCYVFEDSFNGVRAGNNSGALTIMIPDQVQPTEEIRNLCDGIYKSFKEVLEAIKREEI